MNVLVCPECGAGAVSKPDTVIYGRSYGRRVWVCPQGCDCYVGSHPDGRPLGTLADKELRRARIDAHAEFDRWRNRMDLRRKVAYQDLATVMEVKEAHIGEMTLKQCRVVIGHYKALRT